MWWGHAVKSNREKQTWLVLSTSVSNSAAHQSHFFPFPHLSFNSRPFVVYSKSPRNMLIFANSLFPPSHFYLSTQKPFSPPSLPSCPHPHSLPSPGPKCTTSVGLCRPDQMLILCSGSLAATQRRHRSAASSEFQGKRQQKKVWFWKGWWIKVEHSKSGESAVLKNIIARCCRVRFANACEKNFTITI